MPTSAKALSFVDALGSDCVFDSGCAPVLKRLLEEAQNVMRRDQVFVKTGANPPPGVRKFVVCP
jgi:hypothetical protein